MEIVCHNYRKVGNYNNSQIAKTCLITDYNENKMIKISFIQF